MAKVLDALAKAQKAREDRDRQQGQSAPPTSATKTPAQPAQEADHTFSAPASAKNAKAASPTSRQRGDRSYHPEIDERIISVHDQQSPVAEQVRQIRTNMESVLNDYHSRTLVITSPIAGDGKTLVAANLSTVLADSPNDEILLVDADMRKPDQHTLFNLPQAPGLSDYLRGNASLDEVIHPTSLPNLKVIPAGHIPHNPTVLIASEATSKLLSEAQKTFRWIIFDTPPLLPVTDASLIARESVGLILVVRMGQTHRPQIIRAQELLAEIRLPVLGCILNDFESKSRENNYYYKYYRRENSNGGFKR